MARDLEAEADIRGVIAEYCRSCDDGRAEDFAALFTPDAEYHVTGELYGQVRRGRAEIAEHIGTRRPNYSPDRHVTYNEAIDADSAAGAARAVLDFHHLWSEGDGYRIGFAGRYHMRLVREGDGWLIERHTVVFRGDEAPAEP
jgi:uncharacterized protein (TIGR02246 family)